VAIFTKKALSEIACRPKSLKSTRLLTVTNINSFKTEEPTQELKFKLDQVTESLKYAKDVDSWGLFLKVHKPLFANWNHVAEKIEELIIEGRLETSSDLKQEW
jgi:hypothetical protein